MKRISVGIDEKEKEKRRRRREKKVRNKNEKIHFLSNDKPQRSKKERRE